MTTKKYSTQEVLESKKQIKDILSGDNLLKQFKEGGFFAPIKDDSQTSFLQPQNVKFNMDEVIDLPYFSINKKKFIKELPENVTSRNIAGNLLSPSGNHKFTLKIALMTLYASILSFDNKYLDSRKNLEKIFKENEMGELSKNDKTMLKKVSKVFGISGDRLGMFFDKYVYEINDEDVKNFIVRTYKNKYTNKDIYTLDLFEDNQDIKPEFVEPEPNKELNGYVKEVLDTVQSDPKDFFLKFENTVIGKLENEEDRIYQRIDLVDAFKKAYEESHKLEFLKAYMLSIDYLLSHNHELDITKNLIDLKNGDRFQDEIASFAKAIEHKYHQEPLKIDDYKEYHNLAVMNYLLGNHRTNIYTMSSLKDQKKLQIIYDQYLQENPFINNNSLLEEYIKGHFVKNDFNNSFSKSINTRVVDYHLERMVNRELPEKTIDLIFDKIAVTDFSDNYEISELVRLFNAQNHNPYFMDVFKERLPLIIQQNSKIGEEIVQIAFETALQNNSITQVNNLLNFVKTELNTETNLNKEFIGGLYGMVLKQMGNKSEISQLDLSHDDIDTYNIKPTETQKKKITKLKI